MNTQKVKVSILTIFIFSFISCGKSEQEKCEEKEAPWKWNAEQKRCVNPNSPDGDTEEEIIFTNAYADIVNVESGSQSVDLAKGECLKVPQIYLSTLKIRKFGVLSSLNSTSVGPVCDNSDTKTDNNCPFNTNKDYKIVTKPDGPGYWTIQEIDKGDGDSTNCKALLNPASTSGTSATTSSTTGSGTTGASATTSNTTGSGTTGASATTSSTTTGSGTTGTSATTSNTTGSDTTGKIASQKKSPMLIRSHRCHKRGLVMMFDIYKPPTGNIFNTPIPVSAICSVTVSEIIPYTLHAEFYGKTLQECENRHTERIDPYKKIGFSCDEDKFIAPNWPQN